MKAKVLILQFVIPTYRVPVFDKLGKQFDLTVAYVSKDDSPVDVSYKRIKIGERHIGPIYFHKIYSLCKQFDVVIYMPNIHCPNLCLVPFLPHKYKTISYSIGLRASYKTRFNINRRKNLLDTIFGLVQFRGNAVLVYFKETLSFWKISEEEKKKCFETRNTTDVLACDIDAKKKDSILFVGSLYKEKKVEDLIYSYKNAYDKYNSESFPKLEILGGGDLYKELERLICQLGLEGKVFMRGPVYDEEELRNYFLKSYACISPNQAGLSVPKSMGYGVPFITLKTAITGGEILHISDGKNGLLMNSLDELTCVIENIYNEPEKFVLMGQQAKEYYDENANIDIMVSGFVNAISYVIKK